MDAIAEQEPVRLAGLVVHCRTDRVDEVKRSLVTIRGVEIHQQDERGTLVVTAEALPGESSLISRIESIGDVAGVVTTSLVYSHDDEALQVQREISI